MNSKNTVKNPNVIKKMIHEATSSIVIKNGIFNEWKPFYAIYSIDVSWVDSEILNKAIWVICNMTFASVLYDYSDVNDEKSPINLFWNEFSFLPETMVEYYNGHLKSHCDLINEIKEDYTEAGVRNTERWFFQQLWDIYFLLDEDNAYRRDKRPDWFPGRWQPGDVLASSFSTMLRGCQDVGQTLYSGIIALCSND